MAATIKSMTKYLSLVEGQAKAAEEVLNQVPQGQQPSPRLFKRLEKVEEALEAQYKRMHDAYAEAIFNPDLKTDEDEEIEAIIMKAKDRHGSLMAKLVEMLDSSQAVGSAHGINQGTARKSMKIEEVLKPKEPLNESMTLEEVEHWLKGYEASMDHNCEVLTQEGI